MLTSSSLPTPRFVEMSNSLGGSDQRREEYFADFKEELEGLNGKIEEVRVDCGH